MRRDMENEHQASLSKSMIKISIKKSFPNLPTLACSVPWSRWVRNASILLMRSEKPS